MKEEKNKFQNTSSIYTKLKFLTFTFKHVDTDSTSLFTQVSSISHNKSSDLELRSLSSIWFDSSKIFEELAPITKVINKKT